MINSTGSALTTFESLDKLIGYLVKVMSVAGFLIFTLYLITNSAFPGNLSLGDSFLFIVIGLVFGFVYLLVGICIYAFGRLFTPFLLPISVFIQAKSYRLYPTSKLKRFRSQFRVSWKKLLLNLPWVIPAAFMGAGLLLLFLLQIFREYNPSTIDALPHAFVLLTLPFFWVLLVYLVERITKRIDDVQRQEKLSAKDIDYLNEQQKMRVGFIFATIVVPLLMSHTTARTVANATMKALNIRHENVTILVTHPYTDLLSDNGMLVEEGLSEQQKRYSEVTVLRVGIGDKVAIKFEGKSNQVFEIPSSHIMLWPITDK